LLLGINIHAKGYEKNIYRQLKMNNYPEIQLILLTHFVKMVFDGEN